MARLTGNGPDWKDVANALAEMVDAWEGVPSISILPATRGGRPSFEMTATLSWGEENSQGALLSASVSRIMTGNGPGDTSAALLLLLYDLDSKIQAVKGWNDIDTA